MANMGLVHAAREIESFGRGPDKMLAHIAPDEAAFVDYLQGGRRTNPHTGLPEYGLFGKILKTVARVAGAVGGFMVGGPLGAAAGSAAATKLTGGSWKQALKAGALSGVGSGMTQGLTGGGWNLTGNATPLSNAVGTAGTSGATPAAGTMSVGSGVGLGGVQVPAGLSSVAAPAAAPTGLSGALSSVGGYPGAVAGLGALSNPLTPEDNSQPAPQLGDNINLNVSPLARAYQPYQGDATKFGEQPGGWQFFDEVNPKPKFLARGGMVRGYALGGPTGPQGPGAGLSGLGGLRMPGIPSQIETPHFEDAALTRAQATDMSPAAQRNRLRQAAVLGYVNARDGGSIHGPGDGKSDDIPAMLSNNEHVFDASVVSDAGNGDSDAGHEVLENIKAEIRRRAGRRHPRKPTPKQRGTAKSLVSKVM